MKQWKLFEAPFQRVMARYYGMMAAAWVAGFLGFWWLAAIFANLLAVAAILGIRFGDRRRGAARLRRLQGLSVEETAKREAV
ncbi:MAG: hypothetical protein RLY31_2829 [Bacteroidota bacterium]|jgi:membrane protein implicated in regulation of membrane protease activity